MKTFLASLSAVVLLCGLCVSSLQAGNAAAATLTTRAAMQKKALLAADTGITASATAGAATLSKPIGTITSEALTTAAAATYTLTLTNTLIAATSNVQVTLVNGTNSAGLPVLSTCTPGAGSMVCIVSNLHASAALNGTLKFNFEIVK